MYQIYTVLSIICWLAVFNTVVDSQDGEIIARMSLGADGLIYKETNEQARSLSRRNESYLGEKSDKPSAGKNESRISGRQKKLRKPTIKRIVHPSLHAAWDEYNHLCILGKFQATFTIRYETSSGSAQLVDKMPATSRGRGRCDQFDEEPVLDLTWKDDQISGLDKNGTAGFTFRVIFQRWPEEGKWGIQQMQLLYNTGHPVFRGATKPRKFLVKSKRNSHRLNFHIRLASSMLCPSPPPIDLYDSEGEPRVIARLSNMQLQAFDFSSGAPNFDSFERCQQVSFGSGVAHPLTTVRNDSLTFAMGMVTVGIAILTVVGYAFYRSHVVNSEKYKNII